jgi:hypothetical protein
MNSDTPTNPKIFKKEPTTRFERRKDTRKKIRVLVRLSPEIIFESSTYDISLSGLFILARSPNILNRVEIDMKLTVYVEFNFETMIEVQGKVSRVLKNEEHPDRNGFAVAIESISEQNKVLLQNMIASL